MRLLYGYRLVEHHGASNGNLDGVLAGLLYREGGCGCRVARELLGCLLQTGDVYGLDHHFRIGIGAEKKDLLRGYEILKNALKEKFNL